MSTTSTRLASEEEFVDVQTWEDGAAPAGAAAPGAASTPERARGRDGQAKRWDVSGAETLEAAVRQRAVVDRALAQLFETTDSLTAARRLFSRYDRNPQNGRLTAGELRPLLKALGKGQWQYTKGDARRVLNALTCGEESLSLASFLREVQLALLEALRQKFLAQSFSSQEEGQDWTRLWQRLTKPAGSASATRGGTGRAGDCLSLKQFLSAARKAGFGAHRGINLRHKTRATPICGMASSLSDAELKSLFTLLTETVQGSAEGGSLTFAGFRSFLEFGVLRREPAAAVADSRAGSPAAHSPRWAHTTPEIHSSAEDVFQRLLQQNVGTLRAALVPAGSFDPQKPLPRLSERQFARRLADLGLELSADELGVLKAEFGTHNSVVGDTRTICVTDFLTRLAAYRRQHHAQLAHQRNVWRQFAEDSDLGSPVHMRTLEPRSPAPSPQGPTSSWMEAREEKDDLEEEMDEQQQQQQRPTSYLESRRRFDHDSLVDSMGGIDSSSSSSEEEGGALPVAPVRPRYAQAGTRQPTSPQRPLRAPPSHTGALGARRPQKQEPEPEEQHKADASRATEQLLVATPPPASAPEAAGSAASEPSSASSSAAREWRQKQAAATQEARAREELAREELAAMKAERDEALAGLEDARSALAAMGKRMADRTAAAAVAAQNKSAAELASATEAADQAAETSAALAQVTKKSAKTERRLKAALKGVRQELAEAKAALEDSRAEAAFLRSSADVALGPGAGMPDSGAIASAGRRPPQAASTAVFDDVTETESVSAIGSLEADHVKQARRPGVRHNRHGLARSPSRDQRPVDTSFAVKEEAWKQQLREYEPTDAQPARGRDAALALVGSARLALELDRSARPPQPAAGSDTETDDDLTDSDLAIDGGRAA